MLKIKQVTLENFCQHERLDIPFSDGLTVVLGPNGAGKSNFLNAIYSAFTGQFDRGPGDIADYIRKPSSGSPPRTGGSYTQVVGTVGTCEFRLRRTLHATADGKGKVDHGLWLDGERHKAKRTASEIEAWITETSGLTSAIMSEFLFIGQEDLFGFLKRSDTDRSKKFAAICGTKGYDQVRDRFSWFVKDDRARYEKSVVSVELVRKSLETARANLTAVETEWTALRGEYGDIDIKELLQDRETRLRDARKALRDLEEREATVDRYSREMELASARLSKAQQFLRDQEKTIALLQREIEKQAAESARLEREQRHRLGVTAWEDAVAILNTSLRANEKRVSLEKKIDATRSRLASIPDTPAFDEKTYLNQEADRAKVIGRLGELDQTLQSVRDMIAFLNKVTHTADPACSCPLCGADVNDWKVDLTSFQEREHELAGERQTCRRRCEELDRTLKDLAGQRDRIVRERQQRTELAQWIRDFEKELSECPAFDPDAGEKLAFLTDLEKEWRQSKQAHEGLLDRQVRETELLATWTTQRDSCQAERDRLENEVKSLGLRSPETRRKRLEDVRAEIATLEERIAETRCYENKLAALQGARDEALRRVRQCESELEEQRQLRDGFGNAPLWFEKCDRAIDWLKKDGLPRLVHRSALGDLVDAINDELGKFADPFRVIVNEDVTFTALFPGGKEIKSKALSGDEKYMLGLAFLSAVNRTFARNLGIMFIDEPTASLDAHHIQLLFRILEQWKRILLRRNQQLIIVTHVEETASIADSVIRLGGETAGSFEPRRTNLLAV